MSNKKKTRISACMIVKNEEALLPGCLKSIKEFVDEIIIVDTGSTDRTIKIAESFGAQIYHHPWEEDFSFHRNQSIDYASGDWIFIIDADERLKSGSNDLFENITSRDDIDSVMVTVLNYFNKNMSLSVHNQIRVFQNNKQIYYSSPVHNQLTGCKSTITLPFFISHYGYDLNAEKMKAKFNRTSKLLKNLIEKDPHSFRHHHDLAVCYQGNHMYMQAAAEGSIAIEMAESQGAGSDCLVLWSHFITAFAYYELKNFKNAEQHSLNALNKYPEHLDSYFILILVYHNTRDWEKLEKSADRYLKILQILWENPSAAGHVINNSASEQWRVHLALGDLYLHYKKWMKADEQFKKALLLTPSRTDCNQKIGDIYRNRGLLETAQLHYTAALKKTTDHPGSLFGLALLNKAAGKSAEYQMDVEKLRSLETDDADILTEIGTDDLNSGRYEQAVQHFRHVLEKRSHDASIYINLALACKYSGQQQAAITYNLKALDIKKDSIEALTNLGHIYFESEQYTNAEQIYLKALGSGTGLLDVHLRLAHIYLLKGKIENCVDECDTLLNMLCLPRNKTLNSIKDLAEQFLFIANAFEQSGKKLLSRQAQKIALVLNPDSVN